jgi:site-specific DNA recombinase
MYRILSNEFYYGSFMWTDPDTGERRIFKGEHQPMITEKEFIRAQVLLGKKGKPQPQTREFAFTGLMRCGECDSSITAEAKNQIICTSCKHKFGYENKTKCPRCHIDISAMKEPTIMNYIYYRCSKKTKKNCAQKCIRLEDLETEFNKELLKLELDEEYLKLALDYLHEKNNDPITTEQNERTLLQKTHDDCQSRLNKLNKDFNSPQNVNEEVYTIEEYRDLKKVLIKERDALLKEIAKGSKKLDDSLELTERTFIFCGYAYRHFNKTKDLKKKREIFATIGSNLILKDKKLIIERLHPYILIENEIKDQRKLFSTLELKKNVTTKEKEAVFAASSLSLRRR